MALDFPSNPVDGQVFGSYVWSASKGVWQSREESAAPAVVSSTPPTIAVNGDIWIDSSDGIAYFYYSDGNTSQWVEIMSSGVTSLTLKADKAYVDSQDNLKANLSGAIFTGSVSSSSSVTGTTPSDAGTSGGLVVRAPSSGSQTSSILQFVNNANTIQYGTISANPNNQITITGPATILNQPAYAGTFLNYTSSTSNYYPATTNIFINGFTKSGNNRLTAQVAGRYFVSAQQLINTTGTGCYFHIFKNGSTVAYAYSNGDDTYDVVNSVLVDLQVNDYLEVYYGGTTTYSWPSPHSYYSVFKVS